MRVVINELKSVIYHKDSISLFDLQCKSLILQLLNFIRVISIKLIDDSLEVILYAHQIIVGFPTVNKINGETRFPKSPRPANPMEICLTVRLMIDIHWNIIIDH